jgi:hypothetical protein
MEGVWEDGLGKEAERGAEESWMVWNASEEKVMHCTKWACGCRGS